MSDPHISLRSQLDRFPRLPLADYPTPLQFLPHLSEQLWRPIYLKRDDEIGPGGGGNKTRKLEYLLAGAQQRGMRKVATFAGRSACRADIRNLNDGRAAVGACAVDVPEPMTEGPSAYPLFLFVRGLGALYVNIASEKTEGGVEPFSLSRTFPFPAKESIPLVGPLERGRTSLGAVLRCEWRSERRSEIELAVRLFPEGGGEEIEIDSELHDQRSDGEVDLYLLGIEIPELPPGRYRLELEAANPATGKTVRTTGLFSIR